MTEIIERPAGAAADPDSGPEGSPPPAFPFRRGEFSDPPAEYAERRATCPMGRVRLSSGDEALLAVRYEDVVQGINDPRLSRDPRAAGAPRMTSSESLFEDPNIITNKNGEDHLRIRRLVASAFTPRRAEARRPAMRAIAAELLDGLEQAGPPADLVAAYCYELPVRIICELLGVPEQDRARFRGWSDAATFAAQLSPEERQLELAAFGAYVNNLLAERRATPGSGLIDDLIAARDGDDRLTETELLYLVMTLIVAGNESTGNTLSRSVLSLLRGDRSGWLRLAADPGLVPAAVHELMRLNVLGFGTLRYAVEDVDLPSGTVRAGEAVLLETGSAARDEKVFPDPDAIRFDRGHDSQLPVFGAGAHYCLGSHLALAELQTGLGMLVERFPGLRLAVEPGRLAFSEGELLSSLMELPVAW
jgi:cytochrome P450